MHGGKRPGSGRKPKFAEDEVKRQIQLATGDEGLTKVWKVLHQKAKTGSITHINTLFAYFYGKPKESVSVEGDLIIGITRRVVRS